MSFTRARRILRGAREVGREPPAERLRPHPRDGVLFQGVAGGARRALYETVFPPYEPWRALYGSKQAPRIHIAQVAAQGLAAALHTAHGLQGHELDQFWTQRDHDW